MQVRLCLKGRGKKDRKEEKSKERLLFARLRLLASLRGLELTEKGGVQGNWVVMMALVHEDRVRWDSRIMEEQSTEREFVEDCGNGQGEVFFGEGRL
jgi:hypothetical protein